MSLSDLVGCVLASALGLALVRWLAPGRADQGLVLVGPIAGALWQRGRGGRGILGGVLGGLAFAAVVLADFFGPHGPGRPGPSSVAGWPRMLPLMVLTSAGFGLVVGAGCWAGSEAVRSLRRG